ncbi:MAG TPA: GTP cyclohydrolase FolE2 [Candidatus Cloacimonadota bacterium]|nr:GTP cyclohydrolase FolE2 [Candidatus Cloacimonadota bacterium]HOH59709.1 GTP cyclohydrolase FolE2 [Candidatus Cloacimonadota bacterium]HPG41184.1 GTP cyclohydrolase FolE2 [bacterium]
MNIPDIQSQSDPRKIVIDKVGVKGLRYPIVVEDRTKGTQHTIADLNIYVELPHHMRGTHMSRFIEILHHYHTEALIANLPDFLAELKETLKAEASYIDISFPYFMTMKAPVSRIESIMTFDCVFTASLKDEYQLLIGVIVPVTSLCPCSKEISAYGAHNQRSLITIKVSYDGFVWLEELIELAQSAASCEIYSLLKRVDEKYVTEKAYNNPMFVEDVVREITLKLQDDPRILSFFVESENEESIHLHNAYAMISRPVK